MNDRTLEVQIGINLRYLRTRTFKEKKDRFNKLIVRKLTQEDLAKYLGITFQQIQKYEKGTNGVSSARLLQLANFLKVPIKYFFEDYQDFSEQSHEKKESQSLNYSFLVKMFNDLDSAEKNKIIEVLRNQRDIKQAI